MLTVGRPLYGPIRVASNVSRCILRSYASSSTSSSLSQKAPTAAYVHLPFCKRKCFYCDFPVEAIGSRVQGAPPRMHEYVKVLCNEILTTHVSEKKPLETIFFGGGTPSLVPPELVQAVLESLNCHIGISSNAEISLEADPGTFDSKKLSAYTSLGITRISVGVQSFQEDLLKVCGRSHTVGDVYEAIELLHNSSVKSWSLDLISGLPHLTKDKWQHSLDEAIKAKPPHISVYDLQVEEGTPFARMYTPGQSPLPLDDDAAEMYTAASETLQAAGYEHYEVSNYARPGYRCAHNQVYWASDDFYGFGLGAASYLGGRRISRPKKMKDYLNWVTALPTTGGVPGGHTEAESKEEAMLDTIMLRLRTADGLDLRLFRERFGAEMEARLRQSLVPFLDRGVAIMIPDHAKESVHGRNDVCFRVRLTDPQGFLLSNDIISSIFAVMD